MARPRKEGASAPSPSIGSKADALRKSMSSTVITDPLALGHVEYVSTGLLSVDHALGGGIPRGRVIGISGEEHSGKTSLAWQIAASFQKSLPESLVSYVDVEHTYTKEFAEMFGVDTSDDRLVLADCETAEDGVEACLKLMGLDFKKSENRWVPVREPVDLIIFDSWGGAPTEMTGLSNLARVGSSSFPLLGLWAARTNATLIYLNHLHEKTGVSFGDPRYETGGRKVRFVRSMGIWVTRSAFDRDANKKRIGHMMRGEIVKNKMGPPSSPFEVYFNNKTGFDALSDALSFLKQQGETFKEAVSGNIMVWEFEGEKIRANGEKAFLDELRSNPDIGTAFIEFAQEYRRSISG